jgi:hypothetical protein
MEIEKINQIFVAEIKQILAQARQKAYNAVNTAMVEAYWQVGKRVVEQEQKGAHHAEYGEYVIRQLSQTLTEELGKGFSERSLREYRQFYLTFPTEEIRRTLFATLTWSHIRLIMRIQQQEVRNYYLKEAAENRWSVRTLDRNIATLYYERLLISQVQAPVEAEMLAKIQAFQQDKFEFIKNPSVLEFLNLPANTAVTELELEKLLIDN